MAGYCVSCPATIMPFFQLCLRSAVMKLAILLEPSTTAPPKLVQTEQPLMRSSAVLSAPRLVMLASNIL